MKRRACAFCPAAILAFLATPRTANSQQDPAMPNIIIGTTPVKLGMTKDIVIQALSAQFVVKPEFANCKIDNPLCRHYMIYQADNFPAGTLQFDRAGKVVKATVERLEGWNIHEEGEIGRALVTTLTNFAAEGLQCSIDTMSSHTYDVKNPDRTIPAGIFRQAIVECGNKRLRIESVKQEGHPNSLALTEEIGCPV